MKYYVVDAFTDRLFGGNPAGVCLPNKPLDAEIMQKIASENNLSETAFPVKPDFRMLGELDDAVLYFTGEITYW